MGIVINVISMVLVVAGLTFFIGGAVGLVRFPDFYTRMHAAGKGDTLSTMLILAGVAIFVLHHFDSEHVLVAMKILGIALFILLTSPTSTHALMQAGYDDGIKPFEKNGKKSKRRAQQNDPCL